MVICGEYFFVENFIADAVIVALTMDIWRKKVSRIRYFSAVTLMTLYSFSIFLPYSDVLNSFPVKALVSLIVTLILFPGAGRRAFLQGAVTLFGVGIIMGGAVSCIVYIFGKEGISSAGTVYVYPSSYPAILICIGIAYFFIKVFLGVLSDKGKKEDVTVEVEISIGEKRGRFMAFVDTGNILREPITGFPVMIGEAEAVKGMIPEDLGEIGVRIIPYSAVGVESGALIGIKVDDIRIKEAGREYRGKNAVLALYNGSFGLEGCSIILHPDMLEKGVAEACC